jgi:hypothetical protein
MALFSERRTNSGTFFLNHCSFIGDRLGRSDIPNELFDYCEAASAATNWLVIQFQLRAGGGGSRRANTYGMSWWSQGPPNGEEYKDVGVATVGEETETRELRRKEGGEETCLRTTRG